MEKEFSFNLRVSITSNYGDRLEISEEAKLGELTFLEMCQVLGQFSDLAKKIKEEKKKNK